MTGFRAIGGHPWRSGLALVLVVALAVVASVAILKRGRTVVVQREAAVPVWGWAEAGEKITVSLGGQSKSTVAGDDGKWSVKLDATSGTGSPTPPNDSSRSTTQMSCSCAEGLTQNAIFLPSERMVESG